tara:strand:- start:12 stop:500 length:489 start_codon:yes stop_codon:yes gene_type:complete
MAGLTIRGKGIKFHNDDEYMTPKSAWEQIKKYIPTNKVIWECFYGDGKSGEYLREMGFEVIHEEVDFFTENEGEIIVSNPPYSCKVKVFERLKALDKPFILLVPVSTITKKFYMDYFAPKCDIIIPSKRIHFIKNGEQTTRSWFDVIYICYKMNLPKQLNYL